MVISKVIKNTEDINMVMDTFSAVDDLSQDDYYRKHFYVHYDGAVSLTPRSNLNLRFTL